MIARVQSYHLGDEFAHFQKKILVPTSHWSWGLLMLVSK